MAKRTKAPRRSARALPDPPNPAPTPYSGPPAVTGSGRTAYVVPTFIGPNAQRAARAEAMTATMEMQDSMAATGETRRPGGASGFADDPTLPRGASARGGNRRASATGGARAFDSTGDIEPLQDPRQSDRQIHQPMQRAMPRPSRRPGSGLIVGSSGRVRALAQRQPKRSAGRLMGAMLVVCLLLLVAGAVWFFVFHDGGRSGTNNSGDDGPNVRVHDNNADDTNNPDQVRRNGFAFTWDEPPPAITREPRWTGRLRVEAPGPVHEVSLNGQVLLTDPDETAFDLPIELDLRDALDSRYVVVVTPRSGTPGELEFELAADLDAPTVSLDAPSELPDEPEMAITSQDRGVEVNVRVNDNIALQRVIVRIPEIDEEQTRTFDPRENEVSVAMRLLVDFPRDGRYRLEVEAGDSVGNTSRWERTLIVDTTAPEIEFDGRAAGETEWTTSDPVLELSGRISDPDGRIRFFSLDGGQPALTPPDSDSARFRGPRERLRVGENRFRVRAEDWAGNALQFTVVVTFVSNEPPQVVQINIGGGSSEWNDSDPMPETFRWEGSERELEIEVWFDALVETPPDATIAGSAADVSESGGGWVATRTVALDGERTDVDIEIRTDNARPARLSFAIVSVPFPPPLMPLHRHEGLALQTVWPLDHDNREPVRDLLPAADGSVLMLLDDDTGVLAQASAALRMDDDSRLADMDDGTRATDVLAVGDRVIVRLDTGELREVGRDGRLLRRLDIRSHPGSGWCVVDADRLAVQTPEGAVVVLDLASGERVRFAVPGRPNGPMAAVAGRYLLLGRGGVTALSLSLRRPVWSCPVSVTDLAANDDGRIVLVATDGRVVLYEGFTNAPVATINTFAIGGRVALMPDGTVVATGRMPDGDSGARWGWRVFGPDLAPVADGPGPIADRLVVGPDGGLWCIAAGYVCRFSAP